VVEGKGVGVDLSKYDKFVKGSDAFLSCARTPEMIIRDLMLLESIYLITGAPGASKTFFCMRMAVSLALGMDFLGHRVSVPRPVLFLGNDSADWDYAGQYFKVLQGMGVTTKEAEEADRLTFISNSPFHFYKGGADELTALARAFAIDSPRRGVVFIDTLRACHYGNENDSQWMHEVMDCLRGARGDTGCSFVVTHHTSKPMAEVQRTGAETARGSGEIIAATDAVLRISKKGNVHTVVPDRLRGVRVREFQYELEWEKDKAVFSRTVQLTEAAELILKKLGDLPHVTRKAAKLAVEAQMQGQKQATVDQRWQRGVAQLEGCGAIETRGVKIVPGAKLLEINEIRSKN
jgi:hypothetical protein